MTGTLAVAAGRLELESLLRAPLVVVADPVVAASGPPATLDDLGGEGARLLDRPGGTILALANPSPGSGLFVWAAKDCVAVLAEPDRDRTLDPAGALTLVSGRLVVGAPEVVAAWGPDVDTGDGSPARARIHRGRHRLGLIVVCHGPAGRGEVLIGGGAAALRFPTVPPVEVPLALAG